MNPKLSFLFGRRSIRKYEPREVPEELLRDLLEAGMAAPSAVGADPWRFIVVRNRRTLKEMAAGLPNGPFLTEAGAAIVVAGELEAANDRQLSYMLQDCSACIENILLAVHALGLGACWLGVHPREQRGEHLRRLFDLPDGVLPVAVLAIGWPAEEKPARTRYDQAKVHDETW
ncbi:MAG: nitroreductase family protein [Myxococcota bacterium]